VNDYEKGFSDGVELAAQQSCIHCQMGLKLENRQLPNGKAYPQHLHPDGNWRMCGAENIRALAPRESWREGEFLLLNPEQMAAMFHEIFTRLAPKFRYKIRDDRYTAESQVNRYRNALKHIATHSKDRDTADDALQALAEGEHLQLWDPRPWDQACELNRNLTIAVCTEILARASEGKRSAP